jgi:hypothetical protein
VVYKAIGENAGVIISSPTIVHKIGAVDVAFMDEKGIPIRVGELFILCG